ncbi:MAG: glycosyltransferase family 39 protein [Methanobacteriota archaeon]
MMDFRGKFTEKKHILIPLAVFFLAFIVRFYFRGDGLFHTDSVIEALRVEATLRERSLNYMHPPGYPGQVILTTIFFAIHNLLTGTASAEFAATFASIFFGSLGVVMLYLLSKEVTGSETAALFSALILVVLPVHLSITTYAKNHGASSFTALYAFYLGFVGVRRNSFKIKLASSLLLGLSIAVRLSNILFLPFIVLVFWKDNFPVKIEKKGDLMKLRFPHLRQSVSDALLAVVPALLILALLYSKLYITDGLYPILYAGTQDSKFMGIQKYLLEMSFEWFMFSVTWPGLIIAIAGVPLLYKRAPYVAGLLFLWAVGLYLYLGNLRTISPRFMIPAIMPVILFMGYALATLYERKGLASIAAIAILFLLTGSMFAKIQPVLDFRHDYCGPCAVGRLVKEKTEPNAMIIVMDQYYHITYYGNRSATGHSNWATDLDGDMKKYHEIISNGRPLYILTDGFGYDTQDRKFAQRLFSEFNIQPLETIQDDDWHRDTIFLQLHESSLFKVTEKNV